MNYIDLIITVLAICSVASFALSVIGVIRFKEFYTRVHSASKGDTLSTMLLLLAVIIFILKTETGSAAYLTSAKVFFILVFMFLTGPTGIHTLINAGYEVGGKILNKKEDSKDEQKDEK